MPISTVRRIWGCRLGWKFRNDSVAHDGDAPAGRPRPYDHHPKTTMSIKIILGIAMITLLAIIIARQFVLGKKMRHYQADEVAVKLRSASPPVLLDVRTLTEFRRGHIAGALHIPVQELGKRWRELEGFREREIVVYCATGPRSVNAVNILQKRGFNAVNLRGGMKAWQAIQSE